MLGDLNTHGTLTMHTDEQLIQQMAGGNQQAFTLLYRRYWEDLFVTAAKVLRGKKEAEDVVQDVLLSLWNRRNELSLQGSLAAYLHTGVRYKCIHYIEKNITRQDYLIQLAEAGIRTTPPNAEINLELKEIQQTINKAIAKMPPKMQEVYKSSRQEHLSYKEISDYMSISVETVKKHIQHALQLIRKDFGSYTFIFIILTCCAVETQTHIGIELLKLLKKSQFAESLIDVDFHFFNRTTG